MAAKFVWRNISRLVRRSSAPVVSVLYFHRVLPEPDPLRPGEPTAAQFERVIDTLASRFDVIRLRDAEDYLASRRGHAVAITFDDGYEDNFSLAAPVLKDRRVPATFFVATSTLNRGTMWNDLVIEAIRDYRGESFSWSRLDLQHESVASVSDRLRLCTRVLHEIKYRTPEERSRCLQELREITEFQRRLGFMMTKDEVRKLAGDPLFDIGAHTISHPILASLDDDEAWSELAGSKAAVEEIIGQTVDLFAYPNGKPGADYGERDVAMVAKAGFRIAVSTSVGGVTREARSLEWPRQLIWQYDAIGKNVVSGAR